MSQKLDRINSKISGMSGEHKNKKLKISNEPALTNNENKLSNLHIETYQPIVWDFGYGNKWRTLVSDKIKNEFDVFFSEDLNDFKFHILVGINYYIPLYFTRKEIFNSESTYLKSAINDKILNNELYIDKEVCTNSTSLVIVLYLISSSFKLEIIKEFLETIKNNNILDYFVTLEQSLILAHYWGLKLTEKIIIFLISDYPSIIWLPALKKTDNINTITQITNNYLKLNEHDKGKNIPFDNIHSSYQLFIEELLNKIYHIKELIDTTEKAKPMLSFQNMHYITNSCYESIKNILF